MSAPRLRLVFWALALALAIPGALLVRRALASVALEREARERAVAERAFDEMERALTELLRIEEERPAGDYDFTSAASPLHARAENALAAGYFQIDADGVVSTPAWAAGVRELAESVAAEFPRPAPAAPVPARQAPAASEALAKDDDDARRELKPPAEPAAAELQAPPEAAAPVVAAARETPEPVITVEPGARVEIGEIAADPELPTLSEEREEGASDAYDALAKLNTGAKERQDRKQRSYVQEQVALPEASVRGRSVSSQPEIASTPAESSRATAEELVARALAAPEPRSDEWGATSGAGAREAEIAAGAASEPRADAAASSPFAVSQLPSTGAVAEGGTLQAAAAETAKSESNDEVVGRTPLANEAGPSAALSSEQAPAPASEPPALAPEKLAALPDEAPAARREADRAARIEERPALRAALVRVVVDPMRGRLATGDVYLLVRNARIGERALRQGVAIERATLERLLTEATLAEGALPEASVALRAANARERAPSTPERRVFTHRLAEPFHALSVVLSFAPFADEGASSVYWLVALFTLSAAVGLFAVYRLTAVALHFAERRSNFAAAVSHELKTPLTAIRLYAEMLRDGLVPSEQKKSEYYGSITGETERLSRLINNVLEFSRIERGARTFELRIGDVAPVVREAVELLRPHAATHGLMLDFAADVDLPAVRFERDALLQVVFNLVDNAVKYGRGEPARVEVGCRREGAGVAIVVRDHGPGVPRQELGRILEPFYRRGDELTRSAPGAGIGLALVRSLAEEMGGVLRVANAEGGGLAVTLELSGAPA